MNRMIKTLALTCAALAFVGCESRTDKVDGGGVLLSLSDFDGLPVVVSASGDCCNVAVETMTLQSILKNPAGASSDLMNVEIQSYEVSTPARTPARACRPSWCRRFSAWFRPAARRSSTTTR